MPKKDSGYSTILIKKGDIRWLQQEKRKIEVKFEKYMTWIEFFKYYIQKKGSKKQ